MHILSIAAVITLLLSAAIILLLRSFAATTTCFVESFDNADFSWRDYPLQRLLDPAEFEFLRSRGISEKRVQQLRTERRQLFRLSLRSLARDFQKVHKSLTRCVLVQSGHDRQDLLTLLAKQRLTFYRNMLMAEAWLILHALGCDGIPSIDLLGPLHTMQAQLQQLAVHGLC